MTTQSVYTTDKRILLNIVSTIVENSKLLEFSYPSVSAEFSGTINSPTIAELLFPTAEFN